MAVHKCPACGAHRDAHDHDCSCGWTAKKGSVEKVLASPGPSEPRRIGWGLIVLASLAAVAGVAWSEYFSLEPLGATCRNDDECRGNICLLVSGAHSVCSERCSEDDDCGSSMVCGEARARVMGLVDVGSTRICLPTD